jgi:tetratricopeptide (TPR) repeat protein
MAEEESIYYSRNIYMSTRSFSLNVRFLAIVVVLGILAIVGVYFGHRLQMERHANFYLEQARGAMKNLDQEEDLERKLQNFGKVIDGYSKYSSLKSDDTDVLAERAMLLYEMGNELVEGNYIHDARVMYGQSIGLLEKSLRLDSSNKELRRKAVDVLFSLRQHRDALSHIRLLIDVPKNREDLRDLFDKYDLWELVQERTGQTAASDLSTFKEYGKESIDPEKLRNTVGDERIWMLLEDPELLYILGQCQIGLDEPQFAVHPFEKSLELKPDYLELYPALANALNELDRSEDANYWMDEVVDSNLSNPDAYTIRASYRTNQISKAADAENRDMIARSAQSDAIKAVFLSIQSLIKKASSKKPAPSNLAQLQRTLDYLKSARDEDDTKITPEFCDELVELIRLVLKLDDSVEDGNEEKETIRLGLYLAADAALRRGFLENQALRSEGALKKPADRKTPTWEESRRLAGALVELFPDYDRGYIILSYLYQQIGDRQEAVRWLRKGSENTKKSVLLLWQLASNLVEQGDVEGAREMVVKLKKAGASAGLVGHIESQILFVEKKWAQAAKGLEKVRLELTIFPQEVRKIDFLLAESYGKMGQFDKQRDAYMRAIASDRTWLPGLLGLARARAKAGEIDEAIKTYQGALQYVSQQPNVLLEYAQLLLRSNQRKPPGQRNWNAIETIIEKANEIVPNSAAVIQTRSDLLVAQGKVDEALKLLDNWLLEIRNRKQKNLDQYEQLKGEAEKLSGSDKDEKLEEAKIYLGRAKSLEPGRQAVWQILVRVAGKHPDPDMAARILKAASAELGQTSEIQTLQLVELARRDPKKAIEKIRKTASEADKLSPEEQIFLYASLARLVSKECDDTPFAYELMDKAIKLAPQDLSLQKTYFQMAMRAQDIPAMQKSLSAIAKGEQSESSYALFAQAVVDMVRAEKEEKPELLEKARVNLTKSLEKRANWAPAKLILAQVLAKQKKEDAAVELYMNVVEGGVQSPDVVREVARFLTSRGRFREADALFKKLGARPDTLEKIQRELRSVKTQLQQYDEAIGHARRVADESNAYADQIWLGQLLLISANQQRSEGHTHRVEPLIKEAETVFRKAVNLEPKKPEGWVLLVQLFADDKNMASAEEVIKEAKGHLSPEDVTRVMAQCYESMGQTEKAIAEYEAAMKAFPKDAELAAMAARFYLRNGFNDDSIKQLLRISEGEVKADSAMQRWAKRLQAAILFDEGSGNQRKIVRLLDENLAVDPDSPDDLYTKALLLMADVTGQQNKQARKVLEKLVSIKKQSHPEASFLLAKVYLDGDGGWPKYKFQMRELLDEKGHEPRYVGSFAEELIKHKEFPEAEKWLDRLDKTAPDEQETVQVRSKLLFEKGQYDSVIRLLDGWCDAAASKPKEQLRRLQFTAGYLGAYARQLSEDGKKTMANFFVQQAEDRYQQFISRAKADPILMAGFMAEVGKAEPAIKLFATSWKKSKPKVVASVAFSIMNGRGMTGPLLYRLNGILKKAIAQHPDEIILQMALAVGTDLSGKSDQAEAMYRKMLATSPDNVSAMNNLAVHLACKKKKLDEAERLVDQAINKGGGTRGEIHPDLLDSRAQVMMAKGKNQSALADLGRAIRMRPNSPLYRFHLADALQRSGRTRAAREAFKEAQNRGLYEEMLTPPERRIYRKMKLGSK